MFIQKKDWHDKQQSQQNPHGKVLILEVWIVASIKSLYPTLSQCDAFFNLNVVSACYMTKLQQYRSVYLASPVAATCMNQDDFHQKYSYCTSCAYRSTNISYPWKTETRCTPLMPFIFKDKTWPPHFLSRKDALCC